MNPQTNKVEVSNLGTVPTSIMHKIGTSDGIQDKKKYGLQDDLFRMLINLG